MTENPDVLTMALIAIGQENPDMRDAYEEAIARTFSTNEGAMVMELLEKFVLLSTREPCCDERALREHHGQRMLVAEIRRLANHGIQRPAQPRPISRSRAGRR